MVIKGAGPAHINVDVDRLGRVTGVEFDGASPHLPAEVLAGAVEPGPGWDRSATFEELAMRLERRMASDTAYLTFGRATDPDVTFTHRLELETGAHLDLHFVDGVLVGLELERCSEHLAPEVLAVAEVV